MANILLGLTGSVASIKAPDLFRSLVEKGHQVRAVATSRAAHFFDPVSLDGKKRDLRDPLVCTLDEDEWKPAPDGGGTGWGRGDPVLHIELRRWADLFLVAPLDALTLAKFALGLPDNCLTCVWRAWDQDKPRVVAPAMNTLMWEHPSTRRHLIQLFQDAGAPISTETELARLIGERSKGKLLVAMPESRKLACGDEGLGAMSAIPTILDLVELGLG